MYWKHLTAIAFSQKIRDFPPNENWYDKWLNWTIDGNNKDLEISQGYEHTVPYAMRYNGDELPEIIKEKYGI